MSPQPLYPSSHEERRVKEEVSDRLAPEGYRNPWRKDYARILHSSCFRRLQGKNQLLPGTDSDFFRNRLTHSLEVAQIAHSIAVRLNSEFLKDPHYQIDTSICETACLAHDLGHPPFGHQGENALNNLMKEHGGYEGNAQTLRIISKLEKKLQNGLPENDLNRFGLNLTYRTLAAIIKYDAVIPQKLKSTRKVTKGIYACDLHVLNEIKEVLQIENERLYTIEAQIMDKADEIAYSTYDLEDAMKGGFLSPMAVFFPDNEILNRIYTEMEDKFKIKFGYEEYQSHIRELFDFLEESTGVIFDELNFAYRTSKLIKENSYWRTRSTSYFVGMFIRGISMGVINEKKPWLSEIVVDKDIEIKIELLKKITLYTIIYSPKMHARNFQAEKIITKMYDSLVSNPELMPNDIFEIYNLVEDEMKPRVICDFISGMTDRYAYGFFRRLYHPSDKSFFEPHW